MSHEARADTITLQSTNEEVGGFFGISVSYIPDLDGDLVSDVIVGASIEDGAATADSGRAYIFSGASGAFIRAHSSPNAIVNGRFGTAVTGIGDINNDGRGDYIIGARGEAGPGGRAYVYSGINGALIRTHTSPAAEGGGLFGESVAAIQDLSGDGKPDYIIGASGEDSDKGHAYLYSGGTGALLRTHNSPNPEAGGLFGTSVSGIPDVNNDGRGDYVVGAPFEGPGASPFGAGRAYVYSGLTGR